MNSGAIVMLVIGGLGLWGGLAVCLNIAIKNQHSFDQ